MKLRTPKTKLTDTESLPSWERGLKFEMGKSANQLVGVAPFVGAWIEIHSTCPQVDLLTVAPFVGAWIEILTSATHYKSLAVAPFVGAWIEIYTPSFAPIIKPSLPSWERGLKSKKCKRIVTDDFVAPFVGAWIEIIKYEDDKKMYTSRSLRGSVD